MEQARPGCRAPLASGHSLYGRVATLDGRVATLSTGELPLALTDALRLSLADALRLSLAAALCLA